MLHGDRFLLVSMQLMMMVVKEVVVVVGENVVGPVLERRWGVEFVVSIWGNFVQMLLHLQKLVGIRAEFRGFYFQGAL